MALKEEQESPLKNREIKGDWYNNKEIYEFFTEFKDELKSGINDLRIEVRRYNHVREQVDENKEQIRDISDKVSRLEGSKDKKEFLLNYNQGERELNFDKCALRVAIIALIIEIFLGFFNSGIGQFIQSLF